MMLDRRRRRITVDQYFAEVGETEERYELIDGEVWQMAGGSRQHSDVALAIASALLVKLRGGPCRPRGSDMAVQLDNHNFRYPDVAIYCDPRDTAPEAATLRMLHFPKVIFEVLSPSTAAFDRVRKVAEYKALPSIATIVLVDPDGQTIERYDRADGGTWSLAQLPAGMALVLHDPVLTLTAAEIFG